MSLKSPGARVASTSARRLPEWLIRLCLVIFSPILFFLLLELGLLLFGYGNPTSFFLRRASQGDFITNEKFASQFAGKNTPLRPFLFTLPPRKEPGTLRICVLGESAAMGTPDPAYGLPRMLQAQLQARYPGARFEVLNAAMRGINSFAVRRIVRDCAKHDIDIFLIYMGNNELIGLHGPTPTTPAWAQSLPLLRFLDWVKRLRTGQLIASYLEPAKPEQQDMDYFRAHRMRANDPRVDKARRNFRSNLRDICDTAVSSGANVLLCTVAVNLKNCPPLGSLHRATWTGADQGRWDELLAQGANLEMAGDHSGATNLYYQATTLDSCYAELHYRLARCLETLGRTTEAAAEYQLACDWDALPFRTDSRLNGMIRDEAGARTNRVTLFDAVGIFAQNSEHGVPGQRLFYEHVHPTFQGNFLLATEACRALEATLGARSGPPTGRFLTETECAKQIGYTPYDHVNVAAAMARLCSGPPFLDQLDHAKTQAARERQSKALLAQFQLAQAESSLAAYRAVLEREPAFWPSRYSLGTLLAELKRFPEAAREFRTLTETFPEYARFRIDLATALLRTGQKEQALAEYKLALQLQPRDPMLRKMVDQLAGK